MPLENTFCEDKQNDVARFLLENAVSEGNKPPEACFLLENIFVEGKKSPEAIFPFVNAFVEDNKLPEASSLLRTCAVGNSRTRKYTLQAQKSAGGNFPPSLQLVP